MSYLRKDIIRDYATEAFRYYAACGRLTSDQLKEKVYQQIYEQSKKEFGHRGIIGYSDRTAYAVIKAEEAVAQMQAEFEDILAVERTLAQVNHCVKEAVEIVYFTEPEKELERWDISNRVQKAVMKIHASERTVYYWLHKARKIFAKERGLRIS